MSAKLRTLFVTVLLLCALSSAAQVKTPPQNLLDKLREQKEKEDTSHAALLRVTNVGERPIEGLTVIFPDDRVDFGDIPAGSTTSYVAAPHGVYGHAAYRFEFHGKLVIQPVRDWVGDTPMEGKSFTYELDVRPARTGKLTVRLVEVKRDR